MLERTDTSTDNTSETPMLQPMGVGDILDTTFSGSLAKYLLHIKIDIPLFI